MTAARLDPEVCRRLAGVFTADADGLPRVHAFHLALRQRYLDAAAQLTAAAEMAERHEADLQAIHRDLCAERNAARAQLAERSAPTPSAPGQALDPGADLTPEQLDGMAMWDRDPCMLVERNRPIGAMLVQRAVAEIWRRRAQPALTADEVRAVAREACIVSLIDSALFYTWSQLTEQSHERLLHAIADRVAAKLAGRSLAEQVPSDVHAIIGAAAMESLPDVTNEVCMRVADRAVAKLTGEPLADVDARELQERRSLDPVRRSEIEELVTRRQADMNATERMSAKLAASDKKLRADRPVLCALLDRLLATNKDDSP